MAKFCYFTSATEGWVCIAVNNSVCVCVCVRVSGWVCMCGVCMFYHVVTLCVYAQQGYAFGHFGLCAYMYVEDRYMTQTVLKPSRRFYKRLAGFKMGWPNLIHYVHPGLL